MKIGILTYHRTLNYGGCLQALATRKTLEKMGHEVYYVDYWPDYHKAEYSLFNKYKFRAFTWKGKINYLLNTILTFPYKQKRQKNFDIFLQEHILPFCKPLNETYDIIVYGSDQIWRKQSAMKDYNPIYFGANVFSASRHIGFSASMGVLPEKEDEIAKVKELLSNIDEISVRENDLAQLLESLGFPNIEVTLDPTLLLRREEWDEILPSKPYTDDKYILVYSLWGDVFNKESVDALAKERNAKVIILRGEARHFDSDTEVATAGPATFISLIKNADFVFTSSFHGLVFSILYNKQFYTSFGVNGGRAKSLLSILGLSDRYLPNGARISTDIPLIEYDQVNTSLGEFQQKTIQYLKNVCK